MQFEKAQRLRKNMVQAGMDPNLTRDERTAVTIAYGKAGSSGAFRLPTVIGFSLSGIAAFTALARSFEISALAVFVVVLLASSLLVIPVVIIQFLEIRRAGEWDAVEAVQSLRSQVG